MSIRFHFIYIHNKQYNYANSLSNKKVRLTALNPILISSIILFDSIYKDTKLNLCTNFNFPK